MENSYLSDHDHTENSEGIISQAWAKFSPYWIQYLVLIAIFLGCAFLYSKYKQPYYESSATILIKDEKKGTEDSKVMESFDLLSTKKIIENEMEVLKSRAIISQVVHDLKLYAPVYRKDGWNYIPLYESSPITIEVERPDSIIEINEVPFSYDYSRQIVIINGERYPVNHWMITHWGKVRFNQSTQGQGIISGQLYFSLVKPKRITQSILNRLTVTAVNKLASVISLKLKDEIPRRSEDILNSIIAIYSNSSMSEKSILAKNTISFLDERLKSVSGDLDYIEQRLQKYKSKNNAVDLTSQSRLFLENVSDNDKVLNDINMKLSVLGQVEEFIFSNDIRTGLVPTSLGFEEPVLTSLLNKLYELELQGERLKSNTGEQNQALISVKDQIMKIKPTILENIRSQRKSLELKKSSLSSSNNTYTTMLEALPQQERDIVEITREQNIKSSIYAFLLQKREETALSNSSISSDSKVMDVAESSMEPVSLSNKLIYALAVLLAIIVGSMVIIARDFTNSRIIFKSQVENIIALPVLGEIMNGDTKTPLVLEKVNTSWIAEQFRMLRASVNSLLSKPGCRKILVTSTIKGEGKSFVTANLGLSLALTDKRVVLVDYDLSHPSLAQKISLSKEKGVSDFLNGLVTVDEIINQSKETPNLYLVSAGKLNTNPSDLIMKDRSEELFRQLESRFDYILVDTAPVGFFADAYVLSKFCDLTIFVTRYNKTPKSYLKELCQSKKLYELKNLYVVFNGVKTRGYDWKKNNYNYNKYKTEVS